jgi:molybdopterin synthase catalytic subunit
VIKIQETTLLCGEWAKAIGDDSCGAVVAFEGRVRNHHQNKVVAELRYECFRPMALKVLAQIKEEAIRRWGLQDLWIVHRVGLIPIGEAAVWVAAASSHRQEAFEACAWAMDAIKLQAPIWKKETYADGTQSWVEDHCVHEKPVSI